MLKSLSFLPLLLCLLCSCRTATVTVTPPERENNLVEALPLELADGVSVAACAQRALDITDGRLDALFNNAAFGQVGAVEDLTADLLREQLEVNVIGTH